MSRPEQGAAVAFAPISTHVLDTVVGAPATGVPVHLDRLDGTAPAGTVDGAGWRRIGAGRTDGDGRLRHWVPAGEWGTGRYRLVFDLGAHLGPAAFYPEAVVSFEVTDPARHLHLPLLLSPFGYTTYRGS